MAARVVRPSGAVAAWRRRLLVWLPLLLAGMAVTLAAGPMVVSFNSLNLLGLVLMGAGLAGFVKELDR
ncbi:hypothetical protein [Arthrobacter sp. SDTb3-6]|uniref:hypothetical protein n=1 Tax=Arthrobacter sp. SDTb3-6 TaxID=2713571 RepID=UPI00159D2BDF|nr:hypothetical protein [Arthrobacter sp. SDTb3-6]NVM97804.1 hypothetical protein [Arthrobacter sp. SDTb3-6]